MANYQYKILEIKCIAPSSAWSSSGKTLVSTLATLVGFFKGFHPDYRNQVLEMRTPSEIIVLAGFVTLGNACIDFGDDFLPKAEDELKLEVVTAEKTEVKEIGRLSGTETLACGDSKFYKHREDSKYKKSSDYDQMVFVSDQPVNFSIIEVDHVSNDDLLLTFSLYGDELIFGDKKVLIKTMSSGETAPDVTHPNGLYVITVEITII